MKKQMNLISALLHLNHNCGIVKFLDKNFVTIQFLDVDDITKIGTKFYNHLIEFEYLKQENMCYPDDIVAVIRFVDLDLDQIKNMK